MFKPNSLSSFLLIRCNKEVGKDQESIQSRTTPDQGHHMVKYHIQKNQEVSPFPAGDHKASMNRQESFKGHETYFTRGP